MSRPADELEQALDEMELRHEQYHIEDMAAIVAAGGLAHAGSFDNHVLAVKNALIVVHEIVRQNRARKP